MALFPSLSLEGKVQLNDKTRLNASRSFKAKGSDYINAVKIKPGADGSEIDVLETDSDNWYLDWAFSTFNIDIDSSNNKLDFEEGGTAYVATLSSGTYTLSQLATEIQTQMRSAGTLTYSASYSADDVLTISAGSGFALKPEGANKDNSILPIIGFKDGDNFDAGSSHTGDRTDGLTKAITLTVESASESASITEYITVLSEAGDQLFSNDSDLLMLEPDILKYLPAGRSSFLNVHREAQELIIAWLDEKGYVNVYGDKFSKFDIIDKEEVRQWSKFMVLRLIFESLSNAVDDVFARKSQKYSQLEIDHRNRAVLRIDIDDDGKVDTYEDMSIGTARMIRR